MSILDSFNRDNVNTNIGKLTFTIQYGLEKVHVEIRPDDASSPKSLDAALKVYANALGFDLSRPVTWRRGSEAVSGNVRPDAGETYVAAVSHEQKG